MKQKKNARPIGLGSGLSSLLGAEVEKNTDNYKTNKRRSIPDYCWGKKMESLSIKWNA